ncbi:MAG: hypothetical protein R6T90_01600 [Dissulfuribacterales bacterium]
MIPAILSVFLVLMFIYGLYSVISGKFALRKKHSVKGRPARIAGLFFLAALAVQILVLIIADAARVKSDFGELAVLIIVPLAAVIGGFVGALKYLHNHRHESSEYERVEH